MRNFILGLALIGALAACGPREEAKAPETPAPEAGRAMTDPAMVVRQIYEPYLAQPNTAPSLLDSAPWSNRMRADLTAMMARSEQINEPILDFDPIINAQDWTLSDVAAATEAMAEASHAVVRASFMNSGTRTEVVYDLVWEDDRWKVDNLRGEGWDLRVIATSRG